MPQRLEIPKFSSEAEEADWWLEHQDAVDEEFELAAQEGRLQVRINDVQRPLPPPIYLHEDDWSRARRLAKDSGVAIDVYLQSVVHNALIAEEGQRGRQQK